MQFHDASGVESPHSLCALTELVAMDEAAALKLVFGQMRAGALTEDEATRLCGAVDKYAAENNIDLTRGASKFWLVEFHDTGAGLSGAIVPGDDATDAVEAALGLGAHLGGEACARQIPRRALPDEEWRERLLSAAELRQLAGVIHHYDA
jgi:hypothetical protein